jgi:hypothetical protein
METFENFAKFMETVKRLESEGVSFAIMTQRLEGGTTPPPPVATISVKIVVAKANARCQTGENAQGVPIMEIYPEDMSAVKDRVQFLKDEIVIVEKQDVRADGGKIFKRVAQPCKDRSGRKVDAILYLQDEDVKKVV